MYWIFLISLNICFLEFVFSNFGMDENALNLNF